MQATPLLHLETTPYIEQERMIDDYHSLQNPLINTPRKYPHSSVQAPNRNMYCVVSLQRVS